MSLCRNRPCIASALGAVAKVAEGRLKDLKPNAFANALGLCHGQSIVGNASSSLSDETTEAATGCSKNFISDALVNSVWVFFLFLSQPCGGGVGPLAGSRFSRPREHSVGMCHRRPSMAWAVKPKMATERAKNEAKLSQVGARLELVRMMIDQDMIMLIQSPVLFPPFDHTRRQESNTIS